MATNTTVMATLVKARFESMVRLGACAETLVCKAGFDPRIIAKPDVRIPFADEFRLWQAGRDLIGHPAFALRIGEMSDPRQIGVVGSVALNSPTLRDTGRQFARYARLINDSMEMIEREEEGLYICTYHPQCPPELEPEFAELFFATAITLCRTFTQVDIVPTEMRFRYPEPVHVAEYERIFRCPLHFGQSENVMAFDVRYQDLPVPHHDAYAHTLLTRHASSLLEEVDQKDILTNKVRRYILANLNLGITNVTQCATALNMSQRTLHRRLGEQGTSFQALLDEIRRKLAFEYLSRSEFSIAEVAFLLGYSETSAFHRAFRRWSGKSPAAFRGAA